MPSAWIERTPDLPARAVVIASACTAALAGIVLATQPLLVAVPALVLPVAVLVSSPTARVVYFIFGGLVVFQSSDELTPLKLAFFAGAAVAVAAAVSDSQRHTEDRAYRDLTPLFQASLAIGVLVVASLPVAVARGVPETAWLRDVAPYVLFAVAPVFAFEAQRAMSGQALRRLLVIAGVFGSVSFSARWLSERGIIDASGLFGLPTLMLGAAVFSYAMAVVLDGNDHRLRWLALATLILAGFLSTGTRATVVLLAAPVAIVFGARRRFARRSVRLAIVLPAVVLLVILSIQSFVRVSGADSAALDARLRIAMNTGSASDQSYLDRRIQTEAAWKLFKEAPVLGIGPGIGIAWTDSAGIVTTTPTVDSPVGYLTKFGLLGLVPIAVLGLGFVRFMKRLHERTGERTIAQLALVGFASVFLAWSILQVPFEDKGLASGFLLLLALALSEAREASAGAT